MDLRSVSIGVPVKPIRVAFGSALRRLRAKPAYWERCASSDTTITLRRSLRTGISSEPAGGTNFWIVVKTIPPAGTLSSSCRLPRPPRPRRPASPPATSSACLANVCMSWSSRSIRSVTQTTVGFSKRGSRRSFCV